MNDTKTQTKFKVRFRVIFAGKEKIFNTDYIQVGMPARHKIEAQIKVEEHVKKRLKS